MPIVPSIPTRCVRPIAAGDLLEADDLHAGDLIACWSPGRIGWAISLGTASLLGPRGLRWGPSHVAIIADRPTLTGRRERLWVESTSLCRHACLVRGRPVVGVQAHRPATRLADYAVAGAAVRRLRPTPINRFSTDEAALLSHILVQHVLGTPRPYDLTGALLSGVSGLSVGLGLGRRLCELIGADLGDLFCSELAAAVLMRLGRMNRADPALFSPARLLRTLVRTGVYEIA